MTAHPGERLVDLPCYFCGYDLRAQPHDGKCPECAASVAQVTTVGSNSPTAGLAGQRPTLAAARARRRVAPSALPAGPGLSGSVGAVLVEAAKWCIILAIAVWLSVARLAAWWQRRKECAAERWPVA